MRYTLRIDGVHVLKSSYVYHMLLRYKTRRERTLVKAIEKRQDSMHVCIYTHRLKHYNTTPSMRVYGSLLEHMMGL